MYRIALLLLLLTPGITPLNAQTNQSVQQAQQRAVELYPDLGVKGSDFNTLFLQLRRELMASDPAFFRDPNWPVSLAQRCNQMLSSRKTPETPPPPAQTANIPSSSDSLVARPAADRSVFFDVSAAGVPKPIIWGLDLAWHDEANVRRGVAYAGRDKIDVVRSSFTPTAKLKNGKLPEHELGRAKDRIRIIQTWVRKDADVTLNCDHPEVDPWYGNGSNAERWAQLIDVTTELHQKAGLNVITVAPFNEPDYGWGQGSQDDFYNIAGELKKMPRFKDIRICGGNTLNCDAALPWYNRLKDRLDEGNTHQLAGSFDSYAHFFEEVRRNGDHATADELHNVAEAIVGVEYGMQTGIWWYTAEYARAEFMKASDGVRLGYAEHRPNWTAAAVYRTPEGEVQAFTGSSERQAATTTYRFVSLDRDVYFDGVGPQREYVIEHPGGTGYMQNQPNAERMINISWGDDIQPEVNGRYVLVNRKSGRVVEVERGSKDNGARIQLNTYRGGEHQQWDIVRRDPRASGDFTYFKITAAHSGKAPDVKDWSMDGGTGVIQWDAGGGGNQVWYLEYAGEGWFYIRNRHSTLCLAVEEDSSAPRASIIQAEKTKAPSRQWRLLPVGAPIEIDPPAAPKRLVATPNAQSIRLEWAPSPEKDLSGYLVFRSKAPDGPFQTIMRDLKTPAFVDNTVDAGVEYTYAVKAMDHSLNQSPYSGKAAATATGAATLVANLPFDGNTRDRSENLLHGAPFGELDFAKGISGSGAVSLNGEDNFIRLPATVANPKDLTVATWIYWRRPGPWQRIFDFGNGQDHYMFLTPEDDTGQLRLAFKNGGEEQKLQAPKPANDKWVHVAVTLDASRVRLYLDGKLAAEGDKISIRPSDFRPVLNYIGRSQFPDPMFDGGFDDFRIYNYALSADEIAELTGI